MYPSTFLAGLACSCHYHFMLFLLELLTATFLKLQLCSQVLQLMHSTLATINKDWCQVCFLECHAFKVLSLAAAALWPPLTGTAGGWTMLPRRAWQCT